MKLWIKNLICRLGFGDKLIEYCQNCGVRQTIVWWAESNLWNKIMDSENGCICPSCFSKKASDKNIFIQWTPNQIKFDQRETSI